VHTYSVFSAKQLIFDHSKKNVYQMAKQFLVLDDGNSRLKGAQFSNGALICSWTIPEKTKEHLPKEWLETKWDGILVSSTKRDEKELQGWFEGQKVLFLNHRQVNQVELAYKENPAELGKDRLAGLVGAATLFPKENVCIVDAGTCLTIDFLTADARHLGGIISPGISMRFEAMHTLTGKLPLVTESHFTPSLGTSTRTCMASGVVYGLQSEIEFHLESVCRTFNEDFRLILTGGNAIFLAHRLKHANFVVSDLVFQGMYAVLANLV